MTAQNARDRVLGLVVAGCLAACGGTEQTAPSCTTDEQCSDGSYCNGEETCDPYIGECVSGAPVVCSDGVACTVDQCDEAADTCAATADDSLCGDRESCTATGCVGQPACRALDWSYGATIELTATTAVADATLSVTLDTTALIAASKLQDDCDDLRIVRGDGTAVPHWVEACNTASTVLWIRATDLAAGANELYVSYGNPSAASARSFAQTFVALWDFEGNDLGGWTPGTADYQQGFDGSPGATTTTVTAASGGFALQLRADASCFSPPFDGARTFVERELPTSAGEYCVDFDWRADITGFSASTSGEMVANIVIAGATAFDGRTGCSGSLCTATGTWARGSVTMPAASGTLRLMASATDCIDGNVYFDNVRVRTCAASAELTATVGAELDCSTL